MFGELGPRMKGGLNQILTFFSSGATTVKPQTGNALVVQGGDVECLDNNLSYTGTSVTVNGGSTSSVGSSSNGGAVNVNGGSTAATFGHGGAVTISGGASTGSIGAGGALTLQSGNGTGGGSGAVTIQTGTGSGGSSGGAIAIQTQGAASYGSGNISITTQSNPQSVGNITITAGDATGNITPGSITIKSGSGLGSATNRAGAPVSITAGNGSTTNAAGGALNLTSGNGTGTGNGGNVVITAGSSAAGAAGNVVTNGAASALSTSATGGFMTLPTCAGIPTGTPANVPAGNVPLVFDTASWRLWAYNGTTWQAPLTPINGRNGFVDGNLDSWQGGTSFSLGSAVTQYTADMWRANTASGAAATVSQVIAALGSEIAGMTVPRVNKLRYAMTTAGGGYVSQRIEKVASYNGRSVTVSVYLTAAAAATLVTGVTYVQNFGTGGSPSSTVTATKAVTWAVGTTEARFSVRLDVPSIAGMTLGNNGNDFLEIQLNFATGVTFTLDHSQFQIEESPSTASSNTSGAGGSPTQFEWRGLPIELSRVSRFFQRRVSSGSGTGIASGSLYSTTAANVFGTFPGGSMRASPAITASNTYIIAGVGAVSGTQSLSADAAGWANNVTALSSSSVVGNQIWEYGTLIADARL
ncbi:hypothetical protein [Burkholderia seminalis]|uniref:hypothetical protein n=1 Tax=Burkholderia seminalis TaxID=488731 RepID=UPI000F59E4C5|nr:hypothetical protein [Burkholderia seminalis]RQS84324.1 hypothetical protein DF032_04475 [Burkholderia seminalis]